MNWFLLISVLMMVALANAGEVRLLEEPGPVVKGLCGDRLVFVYNAATTLPKPFIHPLLTPGGREITLNSPPDHVHHHGLMFALGNVGLAAGGEHVVFWGERGKPEQLGRILHKGFDEMKSVADRAWFVARNEWRRNSDDLLMLTERRRITLFSPEGGRHHLLTWVSELTTAGQDLALGGTPGRKVSYYGLGLRVPREMDGGEILDANGRSGPEAVNGDDARWCAYAAPPQGQWRGFAIFDHPGNPRHPTGWFAMNKGFGYITASLVAHEPYPLLAGQTVRLRYGILAFDEQPDRKSVDEQYERWVKLEP